MASITSAATRCVLIPFSSWARRVAATWTATARVLEVYVRFSARSIVYSTTATTDAAATAANQLLSDERGTCGIGLGKLALYLET